MSKNLNDKERELVKLVNFFKKRADQLIKEKQLDEEHAQLIQACDKVVETLDAHAANRAEILSQRESLASIVKDNATCPKCHKNTHIKFLGIDKHEKGWKSNKYKCRRCNIEFVWNAPNNPWDMVPFIETVIADMTLKIQNEPEEVKVQSIQAIALMQQNIEKLKPVIEASDKDYEELQMKEVELEKMILEFTKHLMIEKIKMYGLNG